MSALCLCIDWLVSVKIISLEKFLVVVGGGWVGVSVIIASALVLLRQELRPVLENSLGQ